MNSYQSERNGQSHNETQYILTDSVTYAMRAQRLLERSGFRAFVMRDREINRSFGCGYAVKLYGGAQAFDNAKTLLRSAGIPFRERQPAENPPEGGDAG